MNCAWWKCWLLLESICLNCIKTATWGEKCHTTISDEFWEFLRHVRSHDGFVHSDSIHNTCCKTAATKQYMLYTCCDCIFLHFGLRCGSWQRDNCFEHHMLVQLCGKRAEEWGELCPEWISPSAQLTKQDQTKISMCSWREETESYQWLFCLWMNMFTLIKLHIYLL